MFMFSGHKPAKKRAKSSLATGMEMHLRLLQQQHSVFASKDTLDDDRKRLTDPIANVGKVYRRTGGCHHYLKRVAWALTKAPDADFSE
jgi:hypothetical protein